MLIDSLGKLLASSCQHRFFSRLLAGWALLISAVSAQDAGEQLFRGTWQIETPENGALVLLLKNAGLASYFWGDNTDRTVYQGTWTSTDSEATIVWSDGHQIRLTRESTGFSARASDPNGQGIFNSPARQLPQEALGQWAKPPTREDKLRSDREQAQGFFGIWKVGDDEDEYVFVQSDRSAASTSGDTERGRRGQWAKQGSELHLIWDSGHYSILRENERGFSFKTVAQGEIIEMDTSEPVSAIRTLESKVPSDWMAAYEAERDIASGGLAFTSRKDARAFYRGDWIIRRSEGQFDRIGLSRFGGLDSSADRSLDGQWTLSGQDVFMRWDDGRREILSPVGDGFVLYEYQPGRPIDGVPTRVLPASPGNSAKLEEYYAGRADVARQVGEMAAAAGIDPSAQEDAGWGRSFARWVWPFDSSDESASAEALLTEEYEPAPSKDPWWWPFWSEKPEPASAEEVVEVETAEVSEPEVEAAETTEEEPDTKKKNASTKSWIWPF